MERRFLKKASKFLLLCMVGMLLSVQAFAQGITVKGTVVDNTGMSVIGANVVVKGTTNGVITDLDGNFTLQANPGDIIVVSYIGYLSQEFPASDKLVKITLAEDNEMLDEVVVIGYGSVKKNDLTGSVTAIKAEEINRGVVTSPDQMLQGKVPGLLVTPASGDPTGSATIRVRGAASLYASNDPLIVIDGVPVTGDGAGMANPLATVNPNDIESYTVLKDASATAIYGSRASNGVIIIQTKKGTGEKMQVSYSSTYSVKQNSGKVDVMTGDQYRDYMNTTYAGTDRLASIQKFMGTANTDWQDLIYRTAFSTDQNVSLYGNAKGVLPYRVSLGYTYDEATLKVGDNRRTNLAVSLTPKFFQDHLSVNVNLKGIMNKANYPNSGAVGQAIRFSPTQDPYFRNADGSIDYDHANGYFNWLINQSAPMSGQTGISTNPTLNPLSTLYDNYNKNKTWRSMGNLQLDYKIHGFEDLRVNLNLGYDLAHTTGKTYAEIGSMTSLRNQLSNDLYKEYSNQSANTLLEFYGNYNKDFGSHHLDVMAGYSWQHYFERYLSTDYLNADRTTIYNDPPSNRREYYLISFYGRVNYSYDSRYLLTFSLRDDASSRFSKDNRWGLFPSVALAWNIAEESFIRDNNDTPFSSLKLRLGWGQTGQQDIGMDRCYAYQSLYNISTSPNTMVPGFGENGYGYTIAPQAYNPDIKWETTETWNVGLDFGFLNGRINGSVDAYLRKTYDLLNEIPAPMGTNFSNRIISNVGDMKNMGLEFNLNFIPIEQKDMRWTINLNGTWQKTEITELSSNSEDYLGVQVGAGMSSIGGFSSLYRVGYTPYTYYLFQQAYDENGHPLENVLVDRNGDGQISDADRYVTGKSILPKFYFGISTQFTYKKWDFGFNAHGSLGGYALNKATKKDFATSYSDDHTKGYIDNLGTYALETGWTESMTEFQNYSDLFLENASFFRMDNINVGYTFDEFKKWKGNIRVGASVQNVFTITKYSGLDPEITSADGVDNNLIPRPRLYTLRLNINF